MNESRLREQAIQAMENRLRESVNPTNVPLVTLSEVISSERRTPQFTRTTSLPSFQKRPSLQPTLSSVDLSKDITEFISQLGIGRKK